MIKRDWQEQQNSFLLTSGISKENAIYDDTKRTNIFLFIVFFLFQLVHVHAQIFKQCKMQMHFNPKHITSIINANPPRKKPLTVSYHLHNNSFSLAFSSCNPIWSWYLTKSTHFFLLLLDTTVKTVHNKIAVLFCNICMWILLQCNWACYYENMLELSWQGEKKGLTCFTLPATI